MKSYRKRFVQLNMLLIGAVLLLMMGVIAVYMYWDYYDGLRTTMRQVVEPLHFFSQPTEMTQQSENNGQPPADGAPEDGNKPPEDAQNSAGTQNLTESQNSAGVQNLAESQNPDGTQTSAESQTTTDTQPQDNVQPSEQPLEPPGENFPDKGEGRDERDSEKLKEIVTVFYTPETNEISVLSQESAFDEETLEAILESVIVQDESFGTLYNYKAIYYRTGDENLYKIALASTSNIIHSMVSLCLVLFLIWLGVMLCFLFVSIQLSKVAARPLEEAMRREKQFVADASHDLKTPLSVILANNSILRENPQETVGSLSRWIDSTQNAAKNMQQMIGEMLTLADVERQDAPLVLETVDASAVVMKAALQLESVAYEKNIALETEIPDQLLLKSKEDYLQRIAASLMENAIKYEPDGGEVRVRLTSTKRRVLFEVQNKNSFIPEEDLPNIFERFYRGDKSRQGKTGGHGLGLSITKQMTEQLGGRISVESDKDKGTVFIVSFVINQSDGIIGHRE